MQMLFFAGHVKELSRKPWIDLVRDWSKEDKSSKRMLFEMICRNNGQYKYYKDSPIEAILCEDTPQKIDEASYDSVLSIFDKVKAMLNKKP